MKRFLQDGRGISLPAMISISTASSLVIPAHHGRLTGGEVMRVAAVVSFLADSMHEVPVSEDNGELRRSTEAADVFGRSCYSVNQGMLH